MIARLRSGSRRWPALLLFIAVIGGTSPAAAESLGGGAPALEPQPRVQPLLPADSNGAHISEQERLQRRLADLVHERDERIAQLLAGGRNQRAIALPSQPALDEPARLRDLAWEQYQHALHDYLARGHSAARDVLLVTDQAGQENLHRVLIASNDLAIAECFKDLVATTDQEPGAERDAATRDLAAGEAALKRVASDTLATMDQPRLLYLRVWFLAERARRSNGDERNRLGEAAREAQRDLATRFPGSQLTQTSLSLLIDLAPVALSAPALAPDAKP